MKVIVVTVACAVAITCVDLWLYYPVLFGLRPLVDIAATWIVTAAFLFYWKRRFGAWK